MQIERLDHLVLTVADIEASCAFYERVLGMQVVTFGSNRKALAFGQQKINLHERGKEFEPKADLPTPGSADLCFISPTPMREIVSQLQTQQVTIIEGPAPRTGATGLIESVYFRDPDGNLIEVSNLI
ncbi:MAG: VOC family protein [Chloroflexi bacterium]|nr:VOC family protein [Chloroflexota bacterium]MCC6894096.1 VOC family protein [Anaerolineae bacterium]